ncbi:hypothetical protein NC796_00550 [Aliifodinibius sp. S!AR15-10]|uniref:hypothetical protein n=1 Tax=Aliifodinibius sp. S!AR15-10 TaxID=2950437 RepID=UPI0028602328|nr:hypothetical protein [Aliifodinibius sp. S!AR15-10]MDR8389603.1 hypothetical protein [Aliifodinibius sp. S!AR15-10]
MTSKTRDYIYVYDEESHKIIVIDGETGEKIDQKEDRVTSILSYFKENGEIEKLKKFAIWCAHKTNQKLKPIQAKMLDLAEKSIYGKADQEQLEQLYQETEGTAIATDTVGLQHGSANAPAFLASRECINPDPYQGAQQAARFHRLWAELIEEEKNKDSGTEKGYLRQIKVKTSQKNILDVEQKQIDYLLDLMNG